MTCICDSLNMVLVNCCAYNDSSTSTVQNIVLEFMFSVTEKQGLYDRLNEFDPMKQHRTFCPWIVPDDGESLPGWRLTLSALLAHDKRSDGDARVEVQTSFLDEVVPFSLNHVFYLRMQPYGWFSMIPGG
jgi:hypothetical protein